MADSDHSIFLPFVTHRQESKITEASRNTPAEPSLTSKTDKTGMPDPVLALANRWRDAHARALAMCHRQQRLESRILRGVGYRSLEDCVGNKRRGQADLDLGYSKAKAAEEVLVVEADRLLEELSRTPARSLEGLIAKLEVIVRESEARDGPTNFPWPHLRSVLADLGRIAILQPPKAH